MTGQMTGLVLAHMGGAPEALSIAVPLAVVGVFVLMERAARKKARAEQQEDEPS